MSPFKIIFLSLLLVSAVSCSKKDDLDGVIEAQECLDNLASTGASVDTCEQKVGSSTTPAAYGIRCSAGFIREGITASNLISAFQTLDTMNASNVATFLSLISFNNAGAGAAGPVTTNLEGAETTFGHCASSLAKGASIISAFSYLTNTLMMYSCDNNGVSSLMGTTTGSCLATGTDVAAALANIAAGGLSSWLTGNPVSSVGTIVIRAREISCMTGAANATLCDFFNRAVQNAGGTSNPTAVGQAFVAVLLNP